jgi:hypothetical protein
LVKLLKYDFIMNKFWLAKIMATGPRLKQDSRSRHRITGIVLFPLSKVIGCEVGITGIIDFAKRKKASCGKTQARH